ncbi:uroplakin-3b-like [Rhinatrema bivittatum]|uniref:uroplakin-3b-like n=1 Tax=Rhinatrema bivittatum TaxID=194408 RepID=UPI00112D9746|nr:uroplakin-3b-like [Rhinatrema bivittatum]
MAAAMRLSLVLLLVAAVPTATDPAFYSPQVTTQPILGKVTASTFTLEMPLCVFDQSQANDIWLLVAYTRALANMSQQPSTSPYSSFANQLFYTTLKTKPTDYPCVDPLSSVLVLRVGDNTSCVNDPTIQDCNGPLPSIGPYSVKFLAQDPVTKAITQQTRWSSPITLQQAQDPSNLDTFPGRRSGGMIVITSILSVLLAILLACLLAAFIFGCEGLCWRKEMVNKDLLASESYRIKRYNTHHMQNPVQP